MLNVHFFTFNAFQENTYIISNDKNDCWIVDPGMYDNSETKILFDFIAANLLHPRGIINTHTHLDHIFGVQAVVDTYNVPFSIHEKELPVLKNAAGSATLFGFEFNNIPKPTTYIDENVELMLGDDKIELRFAPGHSPGSIIFYYPQGGWLIGGDVLFSGSIGRTDLPGGSYGTLINSIRTQLLNLPDETIVYSGHGPATTIGEERSHNPFLQ